MPSTYSDDLRQSIVACVLQGRSRRETARLFGVSASTVIRVMQRHHAGLALALPRGGARNIKLIPYLDHLADWIAATPDITLREMAIKLHTKFGVEAAETGLSRLLRANGYTYKKISAGGRSGAWQAPQTAA